MAQLSSTERRCARPLRSHLLRPPSHDIVATTNPFRREVTTHLQSCLKQPRLFLLLPPTEIDWRRQEHRPIPPALRRLSVLKGSVRPSTLYLFLGRVAFSKP